MAQVHGMDTYTREYPLLSLELRTMSAIPLFREMADKRAVSLELHKQGERYEWSDPEDTAAS
jgi:hypothetical protein